MTTTLPAPLTTPPSVPPTQWTLAAGIAGVVTAMVTLAVAEVVSLLLGGIGNPILSVGSLFIDLVPGWLKTAVIAVFGTGDKIFLFVVLGILVLALAVVVGVLQLRKPPYGILALATVAVIAAGAAASRADASLMDAAPTAVGAVAGGLFLRAIMTKLRAWQHAAPPRARSVEALTGKQLERRSFLTMVTVAAVASAVVGAGARVMSATAAAVNDLREALTLPAAASPADAVAAGDTFDSINGISSYITPNADFYRIDTALQVPAIDQSTWRLRITGMVEEEIEISFDDLLALPLQENRVTLSCVSNEVGGNLIGNALWLGYPIRELLARAKPTAGADMVLSTSQDGFTASTPLEVLTDPGTDALLAVGMNGEPLPLEHGFPVRMVVPGLYGYVSATKWVTELKVTTFASDEGYWTSRGWTAKGPIKISSRVDTPRSGYGVDAGTVAVAGVAWAPHTGISAVDVRIDGGDWQPATLAPVATVDTWLQWSYAWEATSGSHEITVRATDMNGEVQTTTEAPPAPDGSSGLHTITAQVN